MTEAVHLYDVALGVPADANMFITICGDNVALVLGEEKGGQDRGVSEKKRSSGRVFVRRECVAFLFFRKGCILEWVAAWCEGERLITGKWTDLNTSPNLSETTMAWGSLVNSMAVARFGSSLRVCERDGKACVREGRTAG